MRGGLRARRDRWPRHGWLGTPDAELRAALVASQVIGPALARVKPLASGSPEDLVAALGPTIERHLIGELGKKRHSPTRRTSAWAILRERIRRRAMTGARSPQETCGESCGARDVLRMKRRT